MFFLAVMRSGRTVSVRGHFVKFRSSFMRIVRA